MIRNSVAYVLCRLEDDLSVTPISEHEDIVDGVAAGKHRVEVEDFDFGYGLFADGIRVASFAEGRIGYREWARRKVGWAIYTASKTATTTTLTSSWRSTSHT